MPAADPLPTFEVTASAPSSASPGVTFDLIVTLRVNGNSYGSVPFDWLPLIRFVSSDPGAVLPTDYRMIDADCGSKSFPASLFTTGSQTITVIAYLTGGVGGYVSVIKTITVADTYLFLIDGPSLVAAATSYNYTISCIRNGLVVTDGSWLPSVVFSARGDDGAAFPPTYTFVPADRGVKLLPFTFSNGSSMFQLYATDSDTPSITNFMTINIICELTGDNTKIVTSGVAFSHRILSKVNGQYQTDAHWLPDVSVRSTDASAILPLAPYMFDYNEAVSTGHLFTGLVMNSVGMHTLEFISPDVGGNNVRFPVTVTVGTAATKILATVVRTVGRNTQISITATDAAGNTDLTADGNVSISSANPAFVNSVATPTTAALVAGQVLVTVNSATANTLTISKAGLTSATVRIV